MLLGVLYSGVQAKEDAQKLMAVLPTGTVTFLFTDIEGSTKLWEKSPRGMQIALTRHDAVLWEAIEGHGGSVFKTVGDAFCAVFPTAIGALESALAAQRGLFSEAWGEEIGALRARMALHTGTTHETATTSALRSTGWRGCFPPVTAGRYSSLRLPRSWCGITYRRRHI